MRNARNETRSAERPAAQAAAMDGGPDAPVPPVPSATVLRSALSPLTGQVENEPFFCVRDGAVHHNVSVVLGALIGTGTTSSVYAATMLAPDVGGDCGGT